MFRITQSKTLWLVVLALAAAAHASAGEGDTLITDPDLLERHGFPRDARNVYLAKGAVLDQKNSLAEPEEFGTTDFGWTTILGNQHHPLSSPQAYGQEGVTGEIYLNDPGFMEAQLHMPSGAVLQQVTWFGRDDTDLNELNGSVIRVCQSGLPPGNPVSTLLGSGSSPTIGGFSFTVFVNPGDVVRNLSCAYVARSQLYGTGNTLRLRKVLAGWQRQVSPAPAVATFPNDTPTTHPYFRFIEALAASGITAGCAPGSFCPNNPITRGEMAVFLSVALGLHFTN